MAKREIAERIDGHLAVEASTPSRRLTDTRSEHEAPIYRRTLRSLAASIDDSASMLASRPPQVSAGRGVIDQRGRLERDLHDGVQNELVALIIRLALAQDDPETPPALVEMLAELQARGQAALDSVRSIARGISPALLADFGLVEALRAQAARAAIDVRVNGVASRGTDAAEEAIYFACSEAIQNAAKHAGDAARVVLELRHDQGSLVVRIADDGRGFDPSHTPEGAGVQNIRDRIEDLGGTLQVASSPGHGTVLTISLAWPAAAEGRR